MGKITVKHFLNTDVQSEQLRSYLCGGEEGLILNDKDTLYPVYLQITINRKTTKLRSITKKRLSKQEFSAYQKRGTFYGEKKYNNNNTSRFLSREIELVISSLDYFYNQCNGNQEEIPIKNVVNFYMKNFHSSFFIKKINFETIFSIDHIDYSFIDQIIKVDVMPSFIIDFFQTKLKTDIFRVLGECSNYDPSAPLYKSVSLFFSLMPKDHEGEVIGKMIEWYNGDLQNQFKMKLKAHKYDLDIYYQPFFDFCESLEDRNKRTKFKVTQNESL